jgi:hypothetical protein
VFKKMLLGHPQQWLALPTPAQVTAHYYVMMYYMGCSFALGDVQLLLMPHECILAP